MNTLSTEEKQKYVNHLINRGEQGLGIKLTEADLILSYIQDISDKLKRKELYGEQSHYYDSTDFKALLYRNILADALVYVIDHPEKFHDAAFEQTVYTLPTVEALMDAVEAEIKKSQDFTLQFWKGVILGYKTVCEKYEIKPDIAHTALLSL